MAIKKTAKKGDYKRALRALRDQEGYVEGRPETILYKLGFDGSWEEFKATFGVPVVKTELGRYAVSLSENTQQYTQEAHRKLQFSVDPYIYAACASTFLIGDGAAEGFESLSGRYEEIDVIAAALALHIDSYIGSLYFPYQTESPIEVYTIERSLMYQAPGDNTFMLYGE
jgi:hypothetical protein